MGFDALERRIANFRGRVGVVVEEAAGATLFERHGDEIFPAASVIKLPLVMALYAEGALGGIDLDERADVGARVDGSGVLRHLRDPGALTLRDLATLAVIVSDNTATNRLIERVGVDAVNGYLDRWGCSRSRLRRKMYNLDARARGQENEMTPRETASLLGRLVRGELLDRATSDAVLAVLAGNQDDARLRRYLPDGVWVGHKSGSLERVRNDAGVIRASASVIVAGFCSELASEAEGEALLGLLGWCGYRAAGGAGPDLPPMLV